jgi:hypothetical protein
LRSKTSDTIRPANINTHPINPKLDIFSLKTKKANIAANIGSKEIIIPAIVGVTNFWYVV